MTPRATSLPARDLSRGFTLTELLIVMAVIAVLSVLTLVSVRAVARDARLSSAVNTVTASLDNARALAMKGNTPVLVAFYPRLEGAGELRVNVVTAGWTGDSFVGQVVSSDAGSTLPRVFDRFRPLADAPVRTLPRGTSVAGPAYADDEDDQWLVMTNLLDGAEAAGRIVGVMFGPDGTVLMGNAATDADFFWIDFNDSEAMEMDLDDDGSVTPAPPAGPNDNDVVFRSPPVPLDDLRLLGNGRDEVAISLVPFLSVFDNEDARERYDTSQWGLAATRSANLTEYINTRADRVHFNRYTGVAMK